MVVSIKDVVVVTAITISIRTCTVYHAQITIQDVVNAVQTQMEIPSVIHARSTIL